MFTQMLAQVDEPGAVRMLWFYLQIFIGFSFIVFVHELGHFAVAKWAGVKVERFAIGFFREVIGFTRGETRYSFNLLPLGGYVKMLGQEDFDVDAAGDLQYGNDPRSFVNKTVGQRMAIVSAGVVMNILLAGVLFMIVFMLGKRVPSPQVGTVFPDGPAAEAGMQSGDIIRSINGTSIEEFAEINFEVILSKPGDPLAIEVERNGERKHLAVEPEVDPSTGRFRIGISSAPSAMLVDVGPEYDRSDPQNPRPGDLIVEFEGWQLDDTNTNAMMSELLSNPLRYRSITVDRSERPFDPTAPTERVSVVMDPRLVLQRVDRSENLRHLLGLVPLVRFSEVYRGGRAELAGVRVGDVILRWGDIERPTLEQIDADLRKYKNRANPEQDIPLQVLRPSPGANETLDLVVRPRVRITPLIGKRSNPTIHANLGMYADNLLLVAAVVEEVDGAPSAAAQAGIPAGARITHVDDTPIDTWVELAEAFRNYAGSDVAITYVPGPGDAGVANAETQPGQVTQMHVPATLRTTLGLAPHAVVVSIDGDRWAEVSRGTRSAPVTVSHPLGLRAALSAHVGETVEVEFRRDRTGPLEEASLFVTEEMSFPWTAGIAYGFNVSLGGRTTLLQKSNPFAAMTIGARKTYYFVMQVYQFMERLIFSRSLGVENISGPVGIVRMGGQIAQQGLPELLYFLALISANLAVINFLPLPIVDGGHMVFLLIEKIKGSPVNMRIQIATQVVGIVLIVSCFIFVTLNDLNQ